METRNCFVMLITQSGSLTPLVKEDGQLALFNDYDEAKKAAAENVLAKHFGAVFFDISYDGEDICFV